MTAKQLWDLFFQTGLPEAYVLARRKEGWEKERGKAAPRGLEAFPEKRA